MKFDFHSRRVLDFDIEARPLSWLGGDYTTRDVTAIAAGFDNEHIGCRLIRTGRFRYEYRDMLQWFRLQWDMADMVTGHYIRKYDLPNLNGAMVDFGMAALTPKLVSDTKQDLIKLDGISCSQEALSAMFDLPEPKRHMTQQDWRLANRLQKIEYTIERVTMDVRQHMALRRALVNGGYLCAPRMWYPEVRY